MLIISPTSPCVSLTYLIWSCLLPTDVLPAAWFVAAFSSQRWEVSAGRGSRRLQGQLPTLTVIVSPTRQSSDTDVSRDATVSCNCHTLDFRVSLADRQTAHRQQLIARRCPICDVVFFKTHPVYYTREPRPGHQYATPTPRCQSLVLTAAAVTDCNDLKCWAASLNCHGQQSHHQSKESVFQSPSEFAVILWIIYNTSTSSQNVKKEEWHQRMTLRWQIGLNHPLALQIQQQLPEFAHESLRPMPVKIRPAFVHTAAKKHARLIVSTNIMSSSITSASNHAGTHTCHPTVTSYLFLSRVAVNSVAE